MEYDKKHIGILFDRIASSYDKLNHLFSMNIDKRWRKRLVKHMPRVGHVLDVAIGTGDLAIEICHQQKAMLVTGIDLSKEMMRIGEEKAQGLPVQFIAASALDMPFDDSSFDAVTCGFGCRNFSDLHQGLKEMHRVLREHGNVWILEFSYPSNRLLRAFYSIYLGRIMPAIGGLLSHDKPAYRYLNNSVTHFVWGEDFAQAMREAGFSQVSYQTLSGGIATLYTGTK